MTMPSPRQSTARGRGDLDHLHKSVQRLLGEVSRYRLKLSEVALDAVSRWPGAGHDVVGSQARQDLFKTASRACDDYAAMLRNIRCR